MSSFQWSYNEDSTATITPPQTQTLQQLYIPDKSSQPYTLQQAEQTGRCHSIVRSTKLPWTEITKQNLEHSPNAITDMYMPSKISTSPIGRPASSISNFIYQQSLTCSQQPIFLKIYSIATKLKLLLLSLPKWDTTKQCQGQLYMVQKQSKGPASDTSDSNKGGNKLYK